MQMLKIRRKKIWTNIIAVSFEKELATEDESKSGQKELKIEKDLFWCISMHIYEKYMDLVSIALNQKFAKGGVLLFVEVNWD